MNLAILQRRLKMMGHEVQSSRDGQQCYELFQKFRNGLDFLLMDINVSILLTSQPFTDFSVQMVTNPLEHIR